GTEIFIDRPGITDDISAVFVRDIKVLDVKLQSGEIKKVLFPIDIFIQRLAEGCGDRSRQLNLQYSIRGKQRDQFSCPVLIQINPLGVLVSAFKYIRNSRLSAASIGVSV